MTIKLLLFHSGWFYGSQHVIMTCHVLLMVPGFGEHSCVTCEKTDNDLK